MFYIVDIDCLRYMEDRISSGSDVIDELLKGGYENDIVTTIYGPAGSGKTNLCMISAVAFAASGKRVIYVDTEGGFSIARLKQLSSEPDDILKNIVFLKPINFDEQRTAFDKIRDVINDSIGIIVIDSVAMQYRLEMGKTDDVYTVNRALGQQLAYLTEIARTRKIPVIITNQVYSDFDNKEKVNMVGGDILKYGSKCLIELQKGHKGKRKAILKKHRSLPEGREVMFGVIDEGFEKIE